MSQPASKTKASVPPRYHGVVGDLRRKGRAAGFERLRDKLLLDYEENCRIMPPYSALKIVLETDRHALFAEIAGRKLGGEEGQKVWTDFLSYLQGGVDEPRVPPSGNGHRQRIVVGSGQATVETEIEDEEDIESEDADAREGSETERESAIQEATRVRDDGPSGDADGRDRRSEHVPSDRDGDAGEAGELDPLPEAQRIPRVG